MSAITPTREENFPEWFQQVIKQADMAENSPARGCMVIKPFGYALWENMQKDLDRRIKETGHQNAYFPLFIPLSFLEKEATHVEGFAKECAVVTHHRLEAKDGKLVPAGELEEPLVVRPTSETIIGEAFSRWISSYRDLPLLINQWANVVRWEMRPRIFLRTSEFLWQEGHTAHSTKEEAIDETFKMLQVYETFMKERLALPVIVGEKSPGEKFPGAENTYTLEVMMQDGKALQAGTSHFLGQNFAKGSNIRYCSKEGKMEYVYTTSWGVTTRMIGALIMTHGDDNGLVLPPRIAPIHLVIIPMLHKEKQEEVKRFVLALQEQLAHTLYHGAPLTVHLDLSDKPFGEKKWSAIKKGIPLRLEVGAKEMESGLLSLCRRDDLNVKESMTREELLAKVSLLLDDMQQTYYDRALAFREKMTIKDLTTFEELKAFFAEERRGFVQAKWCGEKESEALLEELKISIRCLPLAQSHTEGRCILTGKPATLDAIFAKSY